MIGRILALAIGLVAGLAFSQLPEFGQQYRQRLGGAIDELRTVMGRFDTSAQASGLSREGAMARLSADSEPLVREQGATMGAVSERLANLEAQRDRFNEGGSFGRLLALVRGPDPVLMRATYLDFEPGWPATTEGVTTGGAGFLLGWLVVLFGARVVRRLSPWRSRARSGHLRSV